MKNALTMLLGMLLIALITPLAQFGTLAMVNQDLETSAASGWTFGILLSILLAAAVLRLVTRRPWLDRSRLVLLFVMLSIAVPVMNLGLARPLVLSLRAVQQHFVGLGVDTYRATYQYQDPKWFPVVPTTEGLAFHQAERMLKMLADERTQRRRQSGLGAWLVDLQQQARRLERGEELAPDLRTKLEGGLAAMGLNEVESIRQRLGREPALAAVTDKLELGPVLEKEFQRLRLASEEARDRLADRLAVIDERTLYVVPSLRKALDRGSQGRLEKMLARLPPSEREALLAAGLALESDLEELRALVTSLGERDRAATRRVRQDLYLRLYADMPSETLAAIRTEFVYRSRTQERQTLYGQAPEGDAPGHDLIAMDQSVFRNAADQDAARGRSFAANLREVNRLLPWQIWRGPLTRWGLLVSTLFLFVFCLSEWLRRKWVDRENLAFPLVEVADHLIRHDFRLESAADLLHPERRRHMFSGVFWVGFGVGAIFLITEIVGHYGPGAEKVAALDVTKNLFSTGTLKNLDNLVYVLSPVLLGIFFLVSLEISFSVWSIYLILRLVFFAVKQGTQDSIKDPLYVGWASRTFPFEMEQLLGASLCFGLLLVVKAWGSRAKGAANPEGEYLPNRITQIGLLLLPLLFLAQAWSMGVRHLPALLIAGVVMVAVLVTGARLRAETGLPLQHSAFDLTRLPLILGLSGSMGARSFTNFSSLVFLPVSLLFRLLPQQLENLELARRHRLRGHTVAIATLLAFFTALAMGLASYLCLNYWVGAAAYGAGAVDQTPSFDGFIAYPLWVAHFLGEEGLETFTRLHATRLAFVGVGAAVFGALVFLRGRILRFPFHPLGYLLMLYSIFHPWLTPYHKGSGALKLEGVSWLWGSAFAAWLIKKLVIKYGGMNTYRNLKPAFIGLIAGALFTHFATNAIDLSIRIRAESPDFEATPMQKLFLDTAPYTPSHY
jgi:hypothetical protein